MSNIFYFANHSVLLCIVDGNRSNQACIKVFTVFFCHLRCPPQRAKLIVPHSLVNAVFCQNVFKGEALKSYNYERNETLIIVGWNTLRNFLRGLYRTCCLGSSLLIFRPLAEEQTLAAVRVNDLHPLPLAHPSINLGPVGSSGTR